MTLRWQCVCVDCADPVMLGRWWASVLGWRITHGDADETVLEPPVGSAEEGVSPDLLFGRVPESKQIKNRLHFDLRPDDQQAEIDRVTALGGRRVDVGQSDDVTWVVMADPEGNEFCILRALRPDELAATS
jgi:predicted enzyme related to lactoylglutathione lyase